MGSTVEITGQKFGMVRALARNGSSAKNQALWLCACDCGDFFTTPGASLRSGNTKSCGCRRRDAYLTSVTKHGHARAGAQSKAYMVWTSMIRRCYAPNDKSYSRYGARGITVSAPWRSSFEQFYEDMGAAPPGHSLERKDNAVGYSKENCRWATVTEQNNNCRSNVMVRSSTSTMTVAEFARSIGMDYAKAYGRIHRGTRELAGIQFEVFKRG